MRLQAVIFGQDSLIDMREVHREAYNRVFAEAGLPWTWDAAQYARLRRMSGAADALETYVRTERPNWRVTDDLQHLMRAARRRHDAVCRDLESEPRFADTEMISLAHAVARSGLRLAAVARHSEEKAASHLPDLIQAETYVQILTALNLRGTACLGIECSQLGLAAARELSIATVDKESLAAAMRHSPAPNAGEIETILRDLHSQDATVGAPTARRGLMSLALIA